MVPKCAIDDLEVPELTRSEQRTLLYILGAALLTILGSLGYVLLRGGGQ
jgi:hypothetical protein